MRKNKRYMILSCLVAVMVMIAGCGIKPPGPSSAPQDDPANPSSSNGKQEVNKQQQEIEVAYVDPDVTQVKTKKTSITFSDNKEKYTQAFDALQLGDDPDYISLWGTIKLESLEFQNGELTLNVHIPDEGRLGSGPEVLALDVLKQTMFQFDEIKSIELLVDGKATESLMGHAELEHPIVRDSK